MFGPAHVLALAIFCGEPSDAAEIGLHLLIKHLHRLIPKPLDILQLRLYLACLVVRFERLVECLRHVRLQLAVLVQDLGEVVAPERGRQLFQFERREALALLQLIPEHLVRLALRLAHELAPDLQDPLLSQRLRVLLPPLDVFRGQVQEIGVHVAF